MDDLARDRKRYSSGCSDGPPVTRWPMALCSECGTANAEGMKFCGECGSPLGERRPGREERRVVTVLFGDVVGFTSRSESLDIEDVGAFLAPFHRIATEQVERFGGVIAKFIGDGVMALFGAPVAHEDDSERAVRAALAVQQQLDTLREERPQLALHVRIGITTGQVLLRFGDDGRVDGVGDAVNTAARLESAAPVDGVLVGARTRRATAGRIEYDEVAPVRAKGKSRPLAAAVARGFRRDDRDSSGHPVRGSQRGARAAVVPIHRVCDARRAATVVVVGPPGAGKSRLVHELRRRVEQMAASGLVAEGALGSLSRRRRAVAAGRDPQAALRRARQRHRRGGDREA